MKRNVLRCQAVVRNEYYNPNSRRTDHFDAPCLSPAAYHLKDGRILCSAHARAIFVDHAIESGYGRRLFPTGPSTQKTKPESRKP